VGVAGFGGAPDPDGAVQIGYAVAEEHQRHGYATEAVTALLAYAFSHSAVTAVVATTYAALTPSIGVLRKTGFVQAGTASDNGLIRFERRRSDRAEM
jgi:RimJ/RimL family protein N-acetyltransferase